MKKILKHLRKNWIRYGFETLAVLIGVLAAFGLNNWNEERLERKEELNTILRIQADIQIDLKEFDFMIRRVKEKEQALTRVKIGLSAGDPFDPLSFLQDIINGATFGWNQGIAQRSTYDDLLGSGKLGIIGDPAIRLAIGNYYRYFEDQFVRMDERETAYPHLSYQLVPRGAIKVVENMGKEDSTLSDVQLDRFISSEWEVESTLSDEQLSRLVGLVNESEIGEYVTSETNLARFMYGIALDLKNRSIVLFNLLEEYRKELE